MMIERRGGDADGGVSQSGQCVSGADDSARLRARWLLWFVSERHGSGRRDRGVAAASISRRLPPPFPRADAKRVGLWSKSVADTNQCRSVAVESLRVRTR